MSGMFISVSSDNKVPIVSDRGVWFNGAVYMVRLHQCVNYGSDRIGGN